MMTLDVADRISGILVAPWVSAPILCVKWIKRRNQRIAAICLPLAYILWLPWLGVTLIPVFLILAGLMVGSTPDGIKRHWRTL